MVLLTREVRAARDELESLFLSFFSKINVRFGTNFTEIHKVLRQIANDMSNDKENFRFAKKNIGTLSLCCSIRNLRTSP